MRMAVDLPAVMVKHLPPSATDLRLLDVEGRCGTAFAQQRQDLDIVTINGAVADQQLAPNSFDAVVGYAIDVSSGLLTSSLALLRPGGRLIIGLAAGRAEQHWVDMLESAGYTRILVERVDAGVLLRGEKPHTEQHTIDRIQQVANRDATVTLENFKGRYVHLLIRQTPNKPVWALRPDEMVAWQAAAIATENGPLLLGFSSLPNAVALMQPAVMQGIIQDVNKVGKFSRTTAQDWSLLLNPELESIAEATIIFVPVDPELAEAPDE